MLNPGPTTRIQSHEYLYTLELPRIHRMLRPIKAKISAIHLAIKSSPSFGYTPINITTNSDSSTQDFPEDSYEIASRNVKQQYGQQSRSLRTGHRGPHNYWEIKKPLSSDFPNQNIIHSENASAPGSSVHIGSETLVRRFRQTLVDQFRDVIEKVWWQPFCEDHDLPLNSTPASVVDTGLAPNSFTLAKSCAMAVGRIVARLNEKDSAQMEKYYNVMPAYMRRFTLLEHLVEMCLINIPIGNLIVPLVEVCAKYKADAQALRLLEHLTILQDRTFQLDYRWAYKMALEIKKGDYWISVLLLNSPSIFFTTNVFHSFLSEIQPQHRADLIQASFDIYMDSSITFISGRVKRSRAIQWTCLLIEDSLRLHDRAAETTGTHHDTVMDQCNKVIEYMAKHLLQTNLESEGSTRTGRQTGFKDVALSLALHSLYVTVTSSSESVGDEKTQEWVQLLETRMNYGIQQMDFDVVVRSYGTLINLNALALMLDAVGLYALSMKLISRMLDDFYALDKKTRKQLGYVCDVTFESLESQLQDVEQRRIQHGSSDLWRYDDMLGDWIERTPKTNKTTLMLLNDDKSDSENDESSAGLEDNNDSSSEMLSTPPSRSSRMFNLDLTSSQPVTPAPRQSSASSHLAHILQHNLSGRPNYTEDSSPFILKRTIRYSMTPIRRSVRSSRQQTQYYNSDSELDAIEDNDGESNDSTIDVVAPLNDLYEEEEDDNRAILEGTSSSPPWPSHSENEYTPYSGFFSHNSVQELSDSAYITESDHNSDDSPAIVLSDNANNSHQEDNDSFDEQDKSVREWCESDQEELQGSKEYSGIKTRHRSACSSRRKRAQNTAESDEEIIVHHSGSDSDFQPPRRTKETEEQIAGPHQIVFRRVVFPIPSPKPSQRVLRHRNRSLSATLVSGNQVSNSITESDRDNANSDDEDSNSESTYRLDVRQKAPASRSEWGSDSGSEEDITVKKRTRNHACRHAAKKTKCSIEDEEDPFRFGTDCFSEGKALVVTESERYGFEGDNDYEDRNEEGNEDSDENIDEEDIAGLCIRDGAFSVGTPLPLTEPDELAFW
ncbi:hypothetical protein BGZ49_002173 [Haplosporangium sp. Z 27]|nr:hypothetical protein BGZ49_002173 [Haplosporangium sp. Z 27]